jgi:hypothetical protein
MTDQSAAVKRPAGEPDDRHCLPEEDRLCRLLGLSYKAGRDVLAAHGDECGCHICHDALGIAFNVEVFRSMVDSVLVRPKGGPVPPDFPYDEDICWSLFPAAHRLLNSLMPGCLEKQARAAVLDRARPVYKKCRADGWPLDAIWDPRDPEHVVHWGVEDGLVSNGEYAACGADSDLGHGLGYDRLGQVPISCPVCLRLIHKLGGPPAYDRAKVEACLARREQQLPAQPPSPRRRGLGISLSWWRH